MSAISLKSITGITSITTPAGVDNQFTLHNNNTTEAVKLDTAGNLHFHNHLNITGVSTASNFKTGTSNLHNTGLNVQDLDVDGHTNLDNVSISGIATALRLDVKNGSQESHFAVNQIQFNPTAAAYIDHKTTSQDMIFRVSNSSATDTTSLVIKSSGNLEAKRDLDVDGHTNLDNVSIAGVTTANTLIIGDTSDTNTSTSDNRIRIGNNQDLQIFHGPNNSYIRNTTNSFNIEQYANATLDIFSNHDVRLRVNGGELAVDCSHNQGVDLYYDASTYSSPKLGTKSTGVYINGQLGIGIAAPTSGSALHIHGGAASDKPHIRITADRGLVARLGDTSGGAQAMFDLWDPSDGSTQIVRLISGSGVDFINTGGNLGIGTVNPLKQLHVFKSSEHPVMLERGDNANTQIEVRTSGATRGYWGCSGTANFMVYDNDASDIHFVVNQTGKIGLGGETSPIALLTLNEGSKGSNTTFTNAELIRLEGYDSTNSKHGIGFGRYNGGANGYKPAAFFGAATGTWSGNTNCHLIFATRNTTGDDEPTERLRITNDGKIGINDTSPSYTLNVIGDNAASNGIGMLKGIIGVQNDTTAYGSSPTAGISFQTKYRTGPDVPLDVAAIWGGKENTTNGDKDGYMGFATREEGGSGTQERMRITSDGKVVAGSNGTGYAERLQAHAAGACLGLNSTSGAAELRFYESGTGRFRMKTLAGNPGIIFEDWTNAATRAEISGDGDFKIHTGTRSWSTIQHRYNSRAVRRHYREFNSGSSATTHNLIRIRRHYWGWGHYKITVKRVYYSGIMDSVFYINGHGRDDGSYNPSYTVTEYLHNTHASNVQSSGRITITSPSTSSPGDVYAAYIDVQLQCPAYMYLIVEVEAAASSYSLDTSSMSSDSYALHQ